MREQDRVKVSKDRFNLQNPYAHLDGDGNFSALIDCEINPADLRVGDFQDKYSDSDIKLIANKLHKKLWMDKGIIWGARSEYLKPNDILDPKVAIELMGFQVGYHKSLGHLEAHNKGHKVAAVINKKEEMVHISDEFDRNMQNFMLAHELGHLVMHATSKMHKDVPIVGGSLRHGTEREADLFAAYFLMPEKLLRQRYLDYFGSDAENPQKLFISLGFNNINSSRRSRSRLLAATTSYKHKNFKTSLAGLFNVSVEAMAIRLEQIGLVK